MASFLIFRKLKRKFCLVLNPSRTSSEELVVLEGKRLIIEALQAGLKPETFIFSRINLLPEFPLDKLQDCQMVQIPYKNISAWSELKTSPGFMGEGQTLNFTMNVWQACLSVSQFHINIGCVWRGGGVCVSGEAESREEKRENVQMLQISYKIVDFNGTVFYFSIDYRGHQ